VFLRENKILLEFVLIQVLLLIDNILEFVKDVWEEVDQVDEIYAETILFLMMLYLFDKFHFEIIDQFLKK
jgi:hypothetical protein